MKSILKTSPYLFIFLLNLAPAIGTLNAMQQSDILVDDWVPVEKPSTVIIHPPTTNSHQNIDNDWTLVESPSKNAALKSRESGEKSLTLLHQAVINNDATGVRQLLEKGANSNAQDGLGKTPLHYAMQKQVANKKIVLDLLDYGAKLTISDNEGKTPLAVTNNKEILSIIIQHLATKQKSSGTTPAQSNT